MTVRLADIKHGLAKMDLYMLYLMGKKDPQLFDNLNIIWSGIDENSEIMNSRTGFTFCNNLFRYDLGRLVPRSVERIPSTTPNFGSSSMSNTGRELRAIGTARSRSQIADQALAAVKGMDANQSAPLRIINT